MHIKEVANRLRFKIEYGSLKKRSRAVKESLKIIVAIIPERDTWHHWRPPNTWHYFSRAIESS